MTRMIELLKSIGGWIKSMEKSHKVYYGTLWAPCGTKQTEEIVGRDSGKVVF